MTLKKILSANRYILFVLLMFLVHGVWIRPAHAAQLSEQDIKLAEIDQEEQIDEEEQVIEEEEAEEVEEMQPNQNQVQATDKKSAASPSKKKAKSPSKKTAKGLVQKPVEAPVEKKVEPPSEKPAVSSAQKPAETLVDQKVLLPSKKSILFPAKEILGKFEFNYAALEGYNRNVRLNSTHKGSFFTDQFLSVAYLNHVKKNLFYRLIYRFRSLNDYKFGDENLMAHNFQVQSSIKLLPNFFLEPEYRFDISRRPHEPAADFDRNEVKVGLKHFLYKDILYHKPSYLFAHHHYEKFRARLPFDQDIPSSHLRADNENAFDYEIGFHPHKNILFQVHNQIGRNDSNDQFFDFYDYSYYRVTPLVTWHTTKKATLIAGFSFQRNNYDDRAIHARAEAEDISTLFGSIFYQLNPHAALGLHWLYVHNDSNVAELEYDDSIFSIGLHLHA